MSNIQSTYSLFESFCHPQLLPADSRYTHHDPKLLRNKRHIIVLLHNPVNKRKCLSVYNCVLVRRVIVTAEAEVTQAVRYIFTVVFFNTLQNVRVCSQNKVCTCVNRLVCKLCLCIVRSGSLFFAPVNTYYNKLCTKTFNRTDNIFKFCRLCFVKCVNSDKSDRYSVYISYRGIRTYKIETPASFKYFIVSERLTSP